MIYPLYVNKCITSALCTDCANTLGNFHIDHVLVSLQALIVSEAYRHCTIRADWVNTLYKKVITQGDFRCVQVFQHVHWPTLAHGIVWFFSLSRYLSDFRSAFSLSPSLIQELANRYICDKVVLEYIPFLNFCIQFVVSHN